MPDMTPDQVADDMQVNKETVLRLLRAGELKGYKVNRSWRITLAALSAFKEGRRDRAYSGDPTQPNGPGV